jgi:hypothetical protein
MMTDRYAIENRVRFRSPRGDAPGERQCWAGGAAGAGRAVQGAGAAGAGFAGCGVGSSTRFGV